LKVPGKNIAFLFVLWLLPFNQALTQSETDSLLSLLEGSSPREKVVILNELSRIHWSVSLEESMNYAVQALEMAELHVDSQGRADALNRIGNVHYLRADYENALSYYNKSLEIRISIDDAQGVLGSYNNIYLIYNLRGDRDAAGDYLARAIDLSIRLDDPSETAHYYTLMGALKSESHEFELAEYYLQGAFDLYKESDNTDGMAQTLNSTGSMYIRMTLYDQAQDCFFRALHLFRETGNMTGVASVKNNLGIIQKQLKNNDLALEYYNRSLELYQEYGIIRLSIAPLLNNIGTIWHEKGDYEKAIDYYRQSLEYYESINSVKGIATATHNIGILYTNMENYAEAMKYYLRSVELNETTGDKFSLANNYNNLGELYIFMDDHDNALTYLEKSEEMALDLNAKNLVSENYLFRSQLYAKTDDYGNAVRYYELYDIYKDSIFSQESSSRIAELQIRNKWMTQINEMDLLQTANHIQMLEIERQNTRLYYLGGLLVVTAAFVIIILIIYRYRKRLNKKLNDKNNQLTTANKELVESERNLRRLNSTKDKFFSIIAHDLKNPFNALMGFSETLNRDYKDLTREQIQTYIQIINKSANDLYQLLENLLEWSKSQTGNINYNPVIFNVAEVAGKGIEPVNVYAERKGISLRCEIDGRMTAWADRNIISTVIRNLTGNAVKFTHTGGFVKISATEKDRFIELSVIDNGIGIGKIEQKKLFSIYHNISTAGTGDEKGTGLGLILCKEFVEKSGGCIWVESTAGKGSVFTFTIPKYPGQPEVNEKIKNQTAK
jgi:signal transduction histidine kinase/Tfp pilus assembly protein PilF